MSFYHNHDHDHDEHRTLKRVRSLRVESIRNTHANSIQYGTCIAHSCSCKCTLAYIFPLITGTTGHSQRARSQSYTADQRDSIHKHTGTSAVLATRCKIEDTPDTPIAEDTPDTPIANADGPYCGTALNQLAWSTCPLFAATCTACCKCCYTDVIKPNADTTGTADSAWTADALVGYIDIDIDTARRARLSYKATSPGKGKRSASGPASVQACALSRTGPGSTGPSKGKGERHGTALARCRLRVRAEPRRWRCLYGGIDIRAHRASRLYRRSPHGLGFSLCRAPQLRQ